MLSAAAFDLYAYYISSYQSILIEGGLQITCFPAFVVLPDLMTNPGSWISLELKVYVRAGKITLEICKGLD